jgi:hypothetical protein
LTTLCTHLKVSFTEKFLKLSIVGRGTPLPTPPLAPEPLKPGDGLYVFIDDPPTHPDFKVPIQKEAFWTAERERQLGKLLYQRDAMVRMRERIRRGEMALAALEKRWSRSKASGITETGIAPEAVKSRVRLYQLIHWKFSEGRK